MDAKTLAPWIILPCFLAAGCDTVPVTAEAKPTVPSARAGSQFEPQSAGTIVGRVTWEGDIPKVPPYRVMPVFSLSPELARPSVRANPNAPVIDPVSRGVGSAVVFLRGVDPQRGRPWDLPPVEVELKGLSIQVLQGGPPRCYGFVQRGAEVRMVSREPLLHALHADGAAFFTLPFPDAEQPLSRRLSAPGVVELSSGTGCYWMRAYLFVTDHPYYCCTDAQGRFTLPAVPAGEYELVCWLPSWLEERRDRDPENFQPVRIYYKAPMEKVQKVVVRAGATIEVNFGQR